CAVAEASVLPLPRPDGVQTASAVVPAAPVQTAVTGAFSGLSAKDMSALRAAFEESDRGRWQTASTYLSTVSDPVAVKLVTWSRLISDESTATFAEIVSFMERNPDWPRMAILAIRAEKALLAYPM